MPQTPPNGCPHHRPWCKGHKHYHGGILDGQTTCMTEFTPADVTKTFGSLLRNLQRSWYELDTTRSHGTNLAYRFIGFGRTGPTHGGPTQTKDQQA